jgi:hypothetical protein
MGILYYSRYIFILFYVILCYSIILYYSMYCLCVYVYKPLPPGVYPIAVDKYIISYHIITADTLKRYFGYTQHVLDTHNSRVLLLGDLNIASFDRELGRLYPAISLYYNKLKVEAIFSSTLLPGLSQHEYSRARCQIA